MIHPLHMYAPQATPDILMATVCKIMYIQQNAHSANQASSEAPDTEATLHFVEARPYIHSFNEFDTRGPSNPLHQPYQAYIRMFVQTCV